MYHNSSMKTLQHKFVEFIPELLEDSILYISMEYCTAIHKCVCGCGNEVVTPISPTDWQLTFNGKTVSLHPSIGNWNFNCKSHYWIVNNGIKHSTTWSQRRVEEGRENDKSRKKIFFSQKDDAQYQKCEKKKRFCFNKKSKKKNRQAKH